tara:strand:- start:780 stop:1193 length:414 start_codon:yes stop_codon:yes gene_type:complete
MKKKNNSMKFYSIDEDIRYTLMELLQESLHIAKADRDGDSVLLYTFLIGELDSAILIDERKDNMGQDLARLQKAERYIRMLQDEKMKMRNQKKSRSKEEIIKERFNIYYQKRENKKRLKEAKSLVSLLVDLGLRRAK